MQALGSFLAVLLIIQIRGDGYFPFPKTWPPDLLTLIVLAHTLALAFFVVRTARALIFERDTEPKVSPRATALFPFVALALIAGLDILQARYFRDAGYRMDYPLLVAFVALAAVPLFTVRSFLVAVFASALIMKVFPLLVFPITAQRSDLLPILHQAGTSFLHGENVYRYYLLDNGVETQNVRLPGLILAYLPAVAANIDLRCITLIGEALIFALLLRGTRVAFAIACFALLPYWHYRHELYEAPFWLLLLLTLIGFHRGRLWAVALGAGAMFGTHQWGWLFFPFVMLAVARTRGLKSAVACAAIALPIGFGLLAIGVGGHLKEFREHVFGFYQRVVEQGDFYPMSMYLTPWLAKAGAKNLLLPIQALIQIPLLIVAARSAIRTHQLAGILALSLFLHLLFNPVAWTYQYLLVAFLLLLGLKFRADVDIPAAAG